MLRSIRAELTKLKGSWLPVIAIAVGVGFSALTWLSVRGALHRLASERRVDVPWENAIVADTTILATLAFPTLIIMITASMFYIEHRNDMWKQLRTTASDTGWLYIAKAVIVVVLVAAAIASALVTAILLWQVLPPEFQRMFGPAVTVRGILVQTAGALLIALIPVFIVQFFISLRSRNILYPIGTGLALTISSLLLSGFLPPQWLPYGYAGAAISKRFSEAAIASRNATDQGVDTSYRAPAGLFSSESRGKRILVDEGHGNRHGIGNYQIPGTLRWIIGPAEEAEIEVEGLYGPVDKARLSKTNLFVIAGATADIEGRGAFTESELRTIVEWINAGGSLLLLTDHPPFSKPVEQLASSFGVHFTNDVVLDPEARIRFVRGDSGVAAHPITKDVNTVMTYTGQGIWRDGDSDDVLLRFSPNARLATKSNLPAGTHDLGQLIAFQFGKGRVVVSGETALFTAQRKLPQNEPIGVADRNADNQRLVANILAWLL